MRTALAAVSIGALFAAPALAAAELADPAQRLFQQGVEAAQRDGWVDARVAFEGARALSTRPVILMNLAGAEARTGRLREALVSYQAILDDTSLQAAPFRDAALSVHKTLEARVPRLRIRAAGLAADDVVVLDDAPLPRADLPYPIPVDPGTHVVTVSRHGAERARVIVLLDESETHEVVLPAALPGPSPGPEAAGPRFALDQPLEKPRAPSAQRRSWWASPWVWTGVVLAASAGAAALALTSHETTPPYSGSIPPGILHVP